MAGRDIAIHVEGLSGLVRGLRRLGDEDLKRALKTANKNAAQAVVDLAMPHVPVLTGNLRQSVRALASQKDARAVAGRSRVPYAAAVHWGTGPRPGLRGPHNIRRRAFLFDSMEILKRNGKIEAEYETQIEIITRLFQGR